MEYLTIIQKQLFFTFSILAVVFHYNFLVSQPISTSSVRKINKQILNKNEKNKLACFNIVHCYQMQKKKFKTLKPKRKKMTAIGITFMNFCLRGTK